MLTIDAASTTLLIVDFQAKLMPAISDAAEIVENTRRLIDVARMLHIPIIVTEQNPTGLGKTISQLGVETGWVVEKMTFDACRAPSFLARAADLKDVVVAGCEAHVCVLQTVLGIKERARRVFVVRDAIGSRREESRQAALGRMDRHGIEIVTAEMAVFEWLETANHPQFREVLARIK